MKRKKLSLSGEMILILLIVLLCAVISILNPTFFTVGNFCDIIRSSTVNGLYAVGVMLVLISGGIDISFPSFAAVIPEPFFFRCSCRPSLDSASARSTRC